MTQMKLNRRRFSGLLASTTFALSAGKALAQGSDTIRIGFVSPRTGPLAGFGKTDS